MLALNIGNGDGVKLDTPAPNDTAPLVFTCNVREHAVSAGVCSWMLGDKPMGDENLYCDTIPNIPLLYFHHSWPLSSMCVYYVTPRSGIRIALSDHSHTFVQVVNPVTPISIEVVQDWLSQ